jgi:iron complex transport system permease protein
VGLFAALVVLMILSLRLGRYPVPVGEIMKIILTTSPIHATELYSNAPWVVVEIVRIPRILIVTLCGMGLALSGAVMQGVFRNPLVGPEIAGVSSGAACDGVSSIMLSLPMYGVVSQPAI